MQGWKTKVGGAGVILTGLGTVCAGVAADPMSMEVIVTGLTIAFGGLGAMGLGHKADKLKAALEFFKSSK